MRIDWSWFFGKRSLKNKIVELEEIVKVREDQIIKASEIVKKYKTELEEKKLEVHTLKVENNLLSKINK